MSLGNAKCTGVNVYEDGRFHVGRLYAGAGGERADVYEGLLSEPQMNDLRLIISNQDFAALHASPGVWKIERDGQGLEAEVRRENGIQRLAVMNDGRSKMPAAILPFMKWIDGLKPDKSLRMENAKPAQCVIAGSLGP